MHPRAQPGIGGVDQATGARSPRRDEQNAPADLRPVELNAMLDSAIAFTEATKTLVADTCK